jgi:hypothetical protein
MTVETQTNFVIFDGDGSAVNFPFTFPIYDVAHLEVRERDTTTLVQTVVSPSDYNVTGIGEEDGGAVVYDVAPATGLQVIVCRLLPLQQDLDVANQGGFYPETVEREFDLEEMQVQQVQEQLNRSVKGPMTESWPLLPPPPVRRGHLLGFTDDEFAYPTIDATDALLGLLIDILQAGFGISITHVGDHIVITNTAPGATQDSWLLEDGTSGGGGGSGGGLDEEFVQDTIASTLVAGSNVTIVYDDTAGTITISSTGASGDVVVTAGDGILVTGTYAVAADPEFIRDTIGTAIVGGPGVTVTVDDSGNTITITTDPKIQTVASAATVTPTFANDQVNVTALAVAAAIANPTGTAVDGHGFVVRIKDNGTARALSFGTKYRAFNDALPTTTVLSKTMYIGCVYNAADDKVDVLCVRSEA